MRPTSIRKLDRTFTFRDLALLVVGNVIGSGIFIVPATVLAQVGGDVGTAQLVWLIGGVLSLLGALTYGELAAMKPEAGGLYIFARDAFGPFVAFLFGWTLFFAIGAGSLATLGAAFAGYLSQFLPLGGVTSRVVAVAMVVVVAAINIRGTRQSANVNNWTTAFKFCALVLIGVALLAAGEGVREQGGSYVPRGLGMASLPAIGLALIGVLWAFEGWQWVTFTAGEAIDPGRTFPKGIVVGTIAIVAVYSLANIGYVAALGPARAMATPSIASTAVETVFGGAAGRLVAAAILVAIFSAANATVLTASRVVFAMSRDGLFFRRLADVHPTLGTPALSIAAFSGWAIMMADGLDRGGFTLAKAVRDSYQRGQTDYTLEPVVLTGAAGVPIGRIRNGDAVIFCCRRGEREIQLTEAFVEPDFDRFNRSAKLYLDFVILTLYHEKFAHLPVAFAPTRVQDTLGEVVSRANLRQLRTAESEKFAHITFFLNGGSSTPLSGEEDIRIPSPKGIPFDQVPELSLAEVSHQVQLGIAQHYDLIVTNFANGDVIGHTSSSAAKIRCAEAVDLHLGQVIQSALAENNIVLVTADHGNLEVMKNPNGTPHVAHTENLVPFILIDPLRKHLLACAPAHWLILLPPFCRL
jgi:basic amino acid/polyamine antiporter, APA family